MADQSASQIGAIFLAIQRLSPGDRRRLQRRLSISGLLDPDEILTDQHPLDVAPALGKGIKHGAK